ncbi:hypothetical protein FA15DRAFT_741830 [Coprinopsis marcescibilis]|uniref:Uncharacterized protein n=1 Tax=Coprinopsis marcescibilis TaxID=230819 RepID=A0A5C3KV89_COPMA|nr:hypothetical protein FA15DRAFT_741830 [Coprinopsis marcescibilis]
MKASILTSATFALYSVVPALSAPVHAAIQQREVEVENRQAELVERSPMWGVLLRGLQPTINGMFKQALGRKRDLSDTGLDDVFERDLRVEDMERRGTLEAELYERSPMWGVLLRGLQPTVNGMFKQALGRKRDLSDAGLDDVFERDLQAEDMETRELDAEIFERSPMWGVLLRGLQPTVNGMFKQALGRKRDLSDAGLDDIFERELEAEIYAREMLEYLNEMD